MNPAEKNPHGGARAGAGRPAVAEDSPTVLLSIRVSAAQREAFKRLGGSAWLRRQIDAALASSEAGARPPQPGA